MGFEPINYNIQNCCFSEVTLQVTTFSREYFEEKEVFKLPRRIIITWIYPASNRGLKLAKLLC